MNARLWSSGLLRGFLAAALGFFMTGCATHRVDWNQQIGKLTYDQAVLQLGPPDKKATLQDGTIVAEWLTQPAYVHTSVPFAFAEPMGYYGPLYGPVYAGGVTTYSPNYFLRLIFGPDHILRDWKKFSR